MYECVFINENNFLDFFIIIIILQLRNFFMFYLVQNLCVKLTWAYKIDDAFGILFRSGAERFTANIPYLWA